MINNRKTKNPVYESYVKEYGETVINSSGENPYRDGTYEYYISEKIKIDNSHGLGPFILAALELDK